MPLLSCRAQPVDCEDATAIAAVATAVASPTLLEQPVAAQEASLDKAELTSGPHLSEAVKEATAADGEMVPVPVSQQRVTSLTGPGINAAFLPGQYGSAEARPATDLPPAEGALQETPTTAAVVAVATANATVAASEQSADDRRFSVASATTAATVVAVTAVAGGDKHQDAATARESSSEVTVPGTSQAELLSIMAASSLASAAATHEANERLGSVIAGGSLQAEPADEAGSRGDVESNQLSGFTSQPAAALQTGPEQQAGAAAGDEPWSILSRGQQHGATEAESCVRTTSSNPVVMPSVKQSVSRLEELHAAMRSKA